MASSETVAAVGRSERFTAAPITGGSALELDERCAEAKRRTVQLSDERVRRLEQEYAAGVGNSTELVAVRPKVLNAYTSTEPSAAADSR